MDRFTAQAMSALTSEFYALVGESFSRTRAGAWPGWDPVLNLLAAGGEDGLELLDLACGNLRFERALFPRVPRAHAWAVDSCDAMAQDDDPRIDYRHCDIAAALMGEGSLPALPPCDAAVCFAFMHHLPLHEQRVRLLGELVGAVRPGGIAAVSFWQFADDGRLLEKARAATEAARQRHDLHGLGHGDYLMGWQDVPDVYRFCHHCDDAEIDGLIDAVPNARVAARYRADGVSGTLNQYVILEKEG